MSLLSVNQFEGIPSTLLLNSLPAVNASILSVSEEIIEPSNSIAYNSNHIDFKVQSSSEYIDTSKLRLHTEFTIKKRVPNSSEWQDLESTDKCSFINSIATSLWRDISISLNDKKVSVDDSQLHYKSIIKTFTSCNKQTCEEKLKYLTGYYKDTCGYFHDMGVDRKEVTGDIIAEEFLNDAFNKRREGIFEGEKRLVYTTNLDFIDIASFSRLLPPGITMKMVLTRNTDQFCLMADKDDVNQYSIHLYKVELLVPMVKTSNAISVSHTESMDKHPLNIPIQRTELRSITLAEGITQWRKTNLFQIAPQKIILAFLDPDNDCGLIHRNPMEFLPYNLKSVKLKIGSDIITPTLDFSNSTDENFLHCISLMIL